MACERHGDEASFWNPTCGDGFAQACNRGGTGRLDKDALGLGKELVGTKDFLIGDLIDATVGFLDGGEGARAAGGVSNANGGSDGLRVFNDVAIYQRGGSCGLPTEHPRTRASGEGLTKSFPVGGDISCIPYGKKMKVGSSF